MQLKPNICILNGKRNSNIVMIIKGNSAINFNNDLYIFYILPRLYTAAFIINPNPTNIDAVMVRP